MLPHITTHHLLKLASGDDLSLQIYRFMGQSPGPKAYIQANLHGAEIVGNAVIYQLIEELTALNSDQLVGEIWLVPVCNPLATNQRSHFFSTGRFNSYDGINWNRIFWDYEKECTDLDDFARSQISLTTTEIRQNFLARQKAAFSQQLERINNPASVPFREQYRYQLQSLCLDAHYVIDIHSSTNLGIDYLYCFNSREISGQYFGLDYGILMTEYDGDAFDEAFMKPWLALERSLAQLNYPVIFPVESYTLELGAGMQMNPRSVAKGVKGIKNYLVYQQMLKLPDYELQSTPTQYVQRSQIKSYYAPTGGMIQGRLPLHQRVNPGDRLYEILEFNKQGDIPRVRAIQAEEAGFIFNLGINEAVNQGEYVLELLTDRPSLTLP